MYLFKGYILVKVIIAGGREFADYAKLKKAIAQSQFDITEVVSGGARGADTLGERWAKENSVPIKRFPAEWSNLKQAGAIVKINKWKKKYNANAGFFRNEEMAKYADGLITVEGGNGTADMEKRGKKHDLQTHKYEMPDEDYEYKF